MDERTELQRLRVAIQQHREERGHDRCHESDSRLYAAAGLAPVDPCLPPIAEHRHACDNWRAGKYNLPLAGEPTQLLRRWLSWYGRSTSLQNAAREGAELAQMTRQALGLPPRDDADHLTGA